MWHKLGVCGQPGSGKSSIGLSYPGVEQHCFGSSEDTTALNFVGRTDILPPIKLDWYDALTEPERAKFTDEKVNELEIAALSKLGRARNVARYRRYLYQLKNDLLAKKRPELQSVFLDNGTPFSQEFEDYVETVWGKDFLTKEGNFDTVAYYKRYKSEFTDFLRLFMSLPCHTIISFHTEMVVNEETAAQTGFLQATKMGGAKKEWMPMLLGKARFQVASIPDWMFFLRTEEAPGQPTKYIAKLEADESNVGVGKPRIQPFVNPRRLEFGRTTFYSQFNDALTSYLTNGQLVSLGGKPA